VFKQANWDVPNEIIYGLVVGGDAVGIEVLVNPQAGASGHVSMPSVVALISSLASMNLMPPHIGGMSEVPPGTIFFRIGRIPPR
jgi:hypothetical protein